MRRLLLVVLLLVGIQHVVHSDPIEDWRGIVVHHSGACTDTVEGIRRYHVDIRGWDYTGYHYVIDREGIVHDARPITVRGAHAKGNKWHVERNSTHIGVCLIGADVFTGAQMEVLGVLIKKLASIYPIVSVERHHENCPGGGVDIEMFNKWVDLSAR